MPRYFAKSEGNFELPTEGSHVASLTTLAFLGQHLNSFSNKYQEMVGLAWATDETDSEGRPLIVLETMNFSMFERSKLYGRILALTGGKEPAPGLDLATLLGKSAIITVTHTAKGDKTFANVTAASPLPRGMAGIIPRAVVYFDLSEFDANAYSSLPKRFQRLADDALGQQVTQTQAAPPLAPVATLRPAAPPAPGYGRPAAPPPAYPAAPPPAPAAADLDDDIPF